VFVDDVVYVVGLSIAAVVLNEADGDVLAAVVELEDNAVFLEVNNILSVVLARDGVDVLLVLVICVNTEVLIVVGGVSLVPNAVVGEKYETVVVIVLGGVKVVMPVFVEEVPVLVLVKCDVDDAVVTVVVDVNVL